MLHLKSLVEQEFTDMIHDMGYKETVRVLQHDQSQLLSEHRPDVFADIIEFLVERNMQDVADKLDTQLVELFYEVATEALRRRWTLL